MGTNQATAGKNGAVIVTYWDKKDNRFRVLVGYVGEDGIKAGKTYTAIDGKLSEVTA